MRVSILLAWRYLGRHKLRAALLTAAVATGVAVLFGTNTYLPSAAAAFRQSLLAATGQVDLVFSAVTAGPFPADYVGRVRQVDGVAAVAGSLRRSLRLPNAGPNAETIPLMIVGVDPESWLQVHREPIRSGRHLAPGDRQVAVVSPGLARRLGLRVGDTLTLPSTTGTVALQVVGVLELSATPGVEEIRVALADAQELFGLPGQINAIEVILKPGADRARVQDAILGLLGEGFRAEPIDFSSEMMSSLRTGEIFFTLLGVFALAVAAFIVLNALRAAVLERQRDVGMLQAVGAPRRTIVGLFLAESLLVGILGVGLGLVAGYGLALLVIAIANSLLRQFVQIEISRPLITSSNLLLAVLLGVGATVAGGILPAWRAGRIRPLDALRVTSPAAYERVAVQRALVGLALTLLAVIALLSRLPSGVGLGLLLFIAGLVLASPLLVLPLSRLFGRMLAAVLAAEGYMARADLASKPNRAAITSSALMLGVAMMLALAGLVSSLRDGFTEYLNRSLGTADLLVLPKAQLLGVGNVGAGPDLARAIRSIPGVADLTSLRLANAAVDGQTIQVVGIDPDTFPRISGLVFSAGEPADAFARLKEGRAAIVNGILSAQLGIGVGLTLRLQTSEGKQEYRVVGVGTDYLNAKIPTVYISHADLARDFHEISDLMLLIHLDPKANAQAVRAEIETLVQRYPAFDVLDYESFRQFQLNAMEQSLAILYLLLIAFAVPMVLGLTSTLLINVLERVREIGVLRAVGAARSQVARIVIAESMLLSALGIAFGIPTGLWLGYALIGLFQTAGFVLPYRFPAVGIALAALVGLGIGGVGAWLPARRAARLDVLAALRYE